MADDRDNVDRPLSSAKVEAQGKQAMGLSADEIIATLNLAPHPEGGHFRETFRDVREREGRSASTAIYFLLKAGEVSRWHRIDAVEIWHWYAGAPLDLTIADVDGAISTTRLGPHITAGEQPQAIVPAGQWQMAVSRGSFSLVGCTVAPGFSFSNFELVPDGFDPGR